jgi:hypothetical protein
VRVFLTFCILNNFTIHMFKITKVCQRPSQMIKNQMDFRLCLFGKKEERKKKEGENLFPFLYLVKSREVFGGAMNSPPRSTLSFLEQKIVRKTQLTGLDLLRFLFFIFKLINGGLFMIDRVVRFNQSKRISHRL